MSSEQMIRIEGREDGKRVSSRKLEERIQQAVENGAREISVAAFGQHGIGGRLFNTGGEPVHIVIDGPAGQRVGSMGFPGTFIEVNGAASDDTGWLNAGAEIVVRGNASNGTCNAMAQGKVWVAGSTGARCMTMTKRNPRFPAPELWVLGSTGDYFAEFMAGGIAVVCGFEAKTPENVLGYRPCVGMVGGELFFRGPIDGFSQADAKLVPISDEKWQWLTENMQVFLEKIGRPELYGQLTVREEWQYITARTPQEKVGRKRRSMSDFRRDVWDAELGRGGLIGDLTDIDRSPIPLVVSGNLRRYVPVWEHERFQAPCQASCPTGMPVQERWRLIREGKVDEAVDVALAYTPFPATVCGYLCPNLCMEGCTRGTANLAPVDVQPLGKASIKAQTPELPPLKGSNIAVIGGGPAGISVAWQLRMMGHGVVVYDMDKVLGGKISQSIPEHRIPKEVLDAELERVREVLPHVHMQQKLGKEDFEQLKADYDYVVVATGAHAPRVLPVPGKERLVPALTFLKNAKLGQQEVGERLVIIGAGNVGCDVATEAARIGARDITLIDIQEPASFGKERQEAIAVGAKFRFPCFTKEITEEGVVLTTGEVIPADTVVVSIGDAPDLDFLSDEIATDRGHIVVNELQQTTDAKVFAIGDVVRPGLLTQAIGMGRTAAKAIDDLLEGRRPETETAKMIDYSRMTLEYFDPRINYYNDLNHCAEECSSCGSCRDCGVCEVVCPQAAIIRKDLGRGKFERVIDADRCIGCGFCAGSCPCGVWTLVPNTPLS